MSAAPLRVLVIDDLQDYRIPVAPSADENRSARRGVFGGVVKQIEQHLLEQHGVQRHHGDVGRQIEPHRMMP